ncbi:TniQ family protein [Streptomyces purpurascens]|uniref:TniQ family protein n=1 Tax=Streptomyces purpurascens TaxID=1924 RepID=UPI0034104C98
MSELRTLAIRVLPQPGESLDSWLEALARRSWTPLSALLDALGLPTEERTHHLLVSLSSQMFQRLTKQLNLPTGVLEQSAVPAALFGRRAPHWRFCPQCLNEQQGRFPTRWWLPWTFACTKHQVLLHSHCAGCRTEPRVFLPRPVHLHPPGHCMRPTGLRTVCGTGLGDLPPLTLPPEHPLLRAQDQLDSLPVSQRMAPGQTFAQVDKCLSPLMESLTATDLRSMSDAARNAWQKALAGVTDLSSPLGSWRLQERRRTILTPDFLKREYTEGQTPLGVIAMSHGIPAKHVIQHAKELGVTVFRGQRPHTIDDEEWLREQYLDRTRSIDDIAQEIGTSGNVVIRHLENLGIPRRPFGTRSMKALNARLDESVPRDIRAAVEGTLHGWLRLRRFQIHMSFPTLQATAEYLGFLPGRLATQFGRLEEAVGEELFHRSVRHAPQRPTSRGRSLLQDLNDPDVQQLMHEALGSQIEPLPDQEAIAAATAVIDGERAALTVLHPNDPAVGRFHVPPPMLPLLEHLFTCASRETYAAQIQITTGIPFTTVYKQLKRMEAAGWLTSRLESREERPGAARRRTYYSLTAAAYRVAARDPHDAPAALRKTTAPRDETTDITTGPPYETPGQEI